MIQPDFKTFCRLARQGNLVPVYDTFTADTLTPVSAFQRIAHDARYACLLESVEGGEKIVITRHGKPVAQLAPPPPSRRQVQLGGMKDRVQLLPGWDAPVDLDRFLDGDL